MDMDLKKTLPEKLEAIAPEYGLIELAYPSFTRTYGFQLASLSAADAVEGLSSLLEAAVGVRLEVEREGGRNGGEWFGGTRTWNYGGGIASRNGAIEDKENVDPRGNPDDAPTQEKKKDENWYAQNFWIAYDACDEYVSHLCLTDRKADKQYQPPAQISPISSDITSGYHQAGVSITG
jgi:cell division control protein 45